MTSLVERTSRQAAVASPMRVPAVAIVVAYCVLLLCVPSQLIVRPLGSPGTPANMLGMLALLWWACMTLAGLNPVKRVTPTRLAVLFLTVAVLAAYASGMAQGWYAPPNVREATADLWTLVPPSAGEIAGAAQRGADRGLLSFAAWMGIVLTTAEGLRSWRDIEIVVEWLTWLAVFVATLGIIQFFTGMNIAGFFAIPGLSANSEFGSVAARSVLNRVSATAVHPIEYGVVLGALMPLVIHRAIQRWGRPMAAIPLAIIFVGTFLSISRSAVLVVAVAMIVLLVGWPNRYRLRALMIAPFAVVGLRLAIPGLVGTLISMFRNVSDDPSTTGRTDDYAIVFEIMDSNPVFGRGLFTFVPRYYRVLDNQYLLFAVEIGIVGLVAVLVLLLGSFFLARTASKRAQLPSSRHFGLAVSASLLAVAFAFGTFDAAGFPMAAGTTMLLVGLAGAAWRLTVVEDPASPYRPHEARVHVRR